MTNSKKRTRIMIKNAGSLFEVNLIEFIDKDTISISYGRDIREISVLGSFAYSHRVTESSMMRSTVGKCHKNLTLISHIRSGAIYDDVVCEHLIYYSDHYQSALLSLPLNVILRCRDIINRDRIPQKVNWLPKALKASISCQKELDLEKDVEILEDKWLRWKD